MCTAETHQPTRGCVRLRLVSLLVFELGEQERDDRALLQEDDHAAMQLGAFKSPSAPPAETRVASGCRAACTTSTA
jgi:hypothetical protein